MVKFYVTSKFLNYIFLSRSMYVQGRIPETQNTQEMSSVYFLLFQISKKNLKTSQISKKNRVFLDKYLKNVFFRYFKSQTSQISLKNVFFRYLSKKNTGSRYTQGHGPAILEHTKNTENWRFWHFLVSRFPVEIQLGSTPETLCVTTRKVSQD